MDASNPIEQRLTDLEIKASFSEDLLDDLNQIVARQQQQMDALISELLQMRQRLPESGQRVLTRAADELPPHY